jgi:scyllo-inositol 2-dehydrogenase (NADP+)
MIKAHFSFLFPENRRNMHNIMLKEDFMKPLRTAILGYGRSGSSLHGNPLEKLPEFTVTAVCDIDQEKLKKARERYKCAVYTDYKKMLKEEELDLVCIITRSDQHSFMACDVMNASIPVLVTKPWAVNASEARIMIETSERSGTPLLPWLPARWGADYRLLKEIMESGEIGKVFCIRRAQFGFSRRNDWQTETKYGGGILLNWGPHLVDIPLLLAGGEVVSVYGKLKQIMNPNDAEDTFQAQFQMKNGISVYTEWNFAPPGQPNWFIQGDRGSIAVHDKRVTINSGEPGLPADPTNAKIMSEANLKTREVVIEGDLYGDSTEIYRHIAKALRKEEPYAVTPAQALQLSVYLDGIRESSLKNDIIKWGDK